MHYSSNILKICMTVRTPGPVLGTTAIKSLSVDSFKYHYIHFFPPSLSSLAETDKERQLPWARAALSLYFGKAKLSVSGDGMWKCGLKWGRYQAGMGFPSYRPLPFNEELVRRIPRGTVLYNT